MFSEAVYVLCGVTALTCAILLFRGYLRSRTRLLLWSALCFVGLTLDNVLLFVDKVIYTDVSLLLVRELGALLGLSLLLYGLVWDTK